MLYTFGEFALSEEEFSLSRNGKRIPLEPRALRVLLVFAGSPGKLLDKKLLLETVWKDTFVEETTLTRSIAVIRKQLGDDPRDPRYIETVPTRGYRFIAAVDVRSFDAAVSRDSQPESLHALQEEPSLMHAAADRETEEETSSKRRTQPATPALFNVRRRPVVYASAVAVVAASLLAFYGANRHARRPLSTRDTLVVADFTNTTGDPAFNAALRQGLLVQLEQSPVLLLASDGQIRKTLKRMGLQEDVAINAQLGRELCQRLSGNVVLDGSIDKLGSTYVIGLRARRCNSGEEVDAEQAQITRKEEAIEALSRLATQFRSRIGEESATLRNLDTPLPEATTTSLDALNAFSHGMQAFNTRGSGAAVPLFRYATELDPSFAWAHAWLGRMYADLGDEANAIASTERAYSLRGRTSERERFTIEVSYDLLVTGNLDKARSACDAWVQMYPHDVYPRAFLSTTVYPAYGQYERTLDEAKQLIELDPDFVVGYRNAATSLIALGRADEAEKVLGRASERKVFLPSFVTDSYRIAFLRGDARGMEGALKVAPRNPWLLYYHAATLAHAGRLSAAEAVQDRALSLARQSSRADLEADLLVTAAYTDLFYGKTSRALEKVARARQLPSGRRVQAGAALILALAGKTAEAIRISEDLRRRFPEDTVLLGHCLPTVEAAIALNRKKPKEALDLLEATSQFGVGLPLHASYLRGLAQMELGNGPQAVAEFRTIVDRPGLVLNDPLFNLAKLNLAKAYALSGERAGARATLAEVRQGWTGADDFPALRQLRLQVGNP